MIGADLFVDEIEKLGIDFFTGVPDSQLKPFTNEIISRYGVGRKNVIAANEGNAVGLASGYYIATDKPGCVYLQNSGLGNIFNPVTSLTNEEVYGIPVLYVVGWRGEPDVHDEPQHVFQGKITLQTLELLNIKAFDIHKDITVEKMSEIFNEISQRFLNRESSALVIRKGALENKTKVQFSNHNTLVRESAIKKIIECIPKESLITSTTGKISRELYENRELNGEGHEKDFLTVGSMGHASSIALGQALSQKNKKIVCIDGDGAVIMHMGAMATIGAYEPVNLLHIVLDNSAHETVGGIPTISDKMDFVSIAKAVGYKEAYEVDNLNDLESVLKESVKKEKLIFIRVLVTLGSRENLGRPKEKPIDNLEKFKKNFKN
jgi:phosphonopyruvate decarboxylase